MSGVSPEGRVRKADVSFESSIGENVMAVVRTRVLDPDVPDVLSREVGNVRRDLAELRDQPEQEEKGKRADEHQVER